MTRWRIPSAAERRADTTILAGFLEPSLAAEIAAMPVVDASDIWTCPACHELLHGELLLDRCTELARHLREQHDEIVLDYLFLAVGDARRAAA